MFISRKYRDERKAKRKFTQSTTLVYIVLTHIVLTMPANITYICLTMPNDSAAHIYDVSEKYPILDANLSLGVNFLSLLPAMRTHVCQDYCKYVQSLMQTVDKY